MWFLDRLRNVEQYPEDIEKIKELLINVINQHISKGVIKAFDRISEIANTDERFKAYRMLANKVQEERQVSMRFN